MRIWDEIGNYLNLYDYPDNFRKKHKSNVPLLGGTFILINILTYLIFEYFFVEKVYLESSFFLEKIFLDSNRSIFGYLLTFTSIYILGFLDDKYNITPTKKLIIADSSSFVVIPSER